LPEDYALRIKQLRGKLGLSQQRFGELMGVSFASINRWENSQSKPSTLAWKQILRAERFGESAFTAIGEGVNEPLPPYSNKKIDTEPPIDFSVSHKTVAAVVEAKRLSYGHLFNPAFATETSFIDPLPHQRIAVYEHMLPQSRLRYLLADDAGAGKTIMTGMYIREMLSRRRIKRILIVPPAGLVGNWKRELNLLFNLRFREVTGQKFKDENPFKGPESDFLIVSIDTLAGERARGRLQEADVEPYDLVVFDEAHKLSADREPNFRIRRTDRYKIAEAIAGVPTADPKWSLPWSAFHLLLLTATPHMGKEYPYFFLWRLLEPEIFSTKEAFDSYPPPLRLNHFIRRTKEEMVRFDGTRIYPSRNSDTFSYDLSQGEISEQRLYDETTAYLRNYYNLARDLNRSAVRLAMGVFQRRLASSTYALMQSFDRRLKKIDDFINAINSGQISIQQLLLQQERLDAEGDIFEEKTGADEETIGGKEENEVAQEKSLAGIIWINLSKLNEERAQVERLKILATRVYEQGNESKFEKLRELLQSEEYNGEKVIIFTEHRDTLTFLFRRLEGLGFAGKVAQIHGGMDYQEREEQIEFFRKSTEEGGATYLIATDAAGEGINLQFCWLMVNYDIPWNPARLEQRMGRIHRYGQQHDPVVILNLVARGTREGRVLETLLEKMKAIRNELGSDKVYDVIGRLFEDVSLREYMELAITEEGAEEVSKKLIGYLTKEQIQALEEKEKRIYGDGGDVAEHLSKENENLKKEEYRHLLPGYVRRFIQLAFPLLDIEFVGNLDEIFTIHAKKSSAINELWPAIELYPESIQQYFSVQKPRDAKTAIFLRPGEPVFDRICALIAQRYSTDALKGSVFIDPKCTQPYLLHLGIVTISKREEHGLPFQSNSIILESRIFGIHQEENGIIQPSPVEQLLLLKGSVNIPSSALGLAANIESLKDSAKLFATEYIAKDICTKIIEDIRKDLPQRERLLRKGFDLEEAELARARETLKDKANAGDVKASIELEKIKGRQRELADRKESIIQALHREPESIIPEDTIFIAHALVVPSTDPEDAKRYDKEIEEIAMRRARGHEEANGRTVHDVSKPELARLVGLPDYPGFDLLSVHPNGEERNIEVKGRAQIGDVEISENEWVKACNLKERYWLYVVYNCASPQPMLQCIQDPFRKLLASPRGGVIIDEQSIFKAATEE